MATACGVPEPRAPSEPIEWPQLADLVRRHSVAPLVERSGWLEAAGAPDDVRTAVAEEARACTLRTLRLLALERDVLAALAEAEVDAVALKGIGLAVDAFDAPFARAVGDLDLLVAPEQAERAVRALERCGLSWWGWGVAEDIGRSRPGREALSQLERYPLLRDAWMIGDGLRVEIHWRLFDNARLLPVDPAWLAEPRHIALQGVTIPTLPLVPQWIYVLLHGSRTHRWCSLKWVADVAGLAGHHPELVERGARAAAATGHEAPMAEGLLVAEAVLGEFLEPGARAWAGNVRGSAPRVRACRRALEAETVSETVPPREVPDFVGARIAARRDAGYRLEELRLLLLMAGRAQATPDPSWRTVVAGPLRWAQRKARQAASRPAERSAAWVSKKRR